MSGADSDFERLDSIPNEQDDIDFKSISQLSLPIMSPNYSNIQNVDSVQKLNYHH